MADKLLKTLTIDGVANDIENCRFPKEIGSKVWGAPATAYPNYTYRYPAFTVTEAGCVVMSCKVSFASNPYGYRSITIDVLRNGNYIGIGSALTIQAASSSETVITCTGLAKVRADDQLIISFAHGSTGGVDITADAKWFFVPDVVGGGNTNP